MPASACAGRFRSTTSRNPRLARDWLWALIVKQARVEGFLVFQFFDRFGPAVAEMARWIKEGKLKYKEDLVEGFDRLPQAFIGMLQGNNTGKRLVKVS